MNDRASKFNLKCLCDYTCNQDHQHSAKVKEKSMKTILAGFETWLLRYRDSVKSRTRVDILNKVVKCHLHACWVMFAYSRQVQNQTWWVGAPNLYTKMRWERIHGRTSNTFSVLFSSCAYNHHWVPIPAVNSTPYGYHPLAMVRISRLSVSGQQQNQLIPLTALEHHQTSLQILIGYALRQLLVPQPEKHFSNFILSWELALCIIYYYCYCYYY